MTAPEIDQAPPRATSRVWTAVGVLGELLITVGVLLLLLVVYQLLWTNVTAQRQADQVASDLQDSWTQQSGTTDGSDEDGEDGEDAPEARPEIGSAFALMYIPRLSDKVWGMPVLESVALSDLARGIGH